MTDIERVKTGIEGLDKALNGGFPKGNLVLVSGGAGTGKSTLGMQYLYNGAKMFGEKGLYVSTEQSEAELNKQASAYGWDLEDLIRKNLLRIEYIEVTKAENALQRIYDAYTSFEPTRMVIDSLTTLTDSLLISGLKGNSAFSLVQVADSVSPIPSTEKTLSKAMLYRLIGKLKLFQATVLLTSELPEESHFLSADQTTEFIADGVIILNFVGLGSAELRSMQIRKMRYSFHRKDNLSYELTDKGVVMSENNDSL